MWFHWVNLLECHWQYLGEKTAKLTPASFSNLISHFSSLHSPSSRGTGFEVVLTEWTSSCPSHCTFPFCLDLTCPSLFRFSTEKSSPQWGGAFNCLPSASPITMSILFTTLYTRSLAPCLRYSWISINKPEETLGNLCRPFLQEQGVLYNYIFKYL